MFSYCSLCSNISSVYNVTFIRKLFLTRIFSRNRRVWGTKKLHRNVKLHFNLNIMADPKIEKILAPLRAAVKEQGDYVKQLKATNAPELDIKKAVTDLKTRKKMLDNKELELVPASAYIDRAKVEDLLKRRFFYDQSFAIYGGVSGQYDFGPMGCALKTNLINTWRSFFILEEQMLEVDCSILTPESVLKASGHVERFADLMVKDTVNGECFRLDHLIKASLEKVISDKKSTDETREEYRDIIVKLDGMTKEEMQNIIYKFNIRSPTTGNPLSEPMDFNLMFSTQIGPTNLMKGFLRPETAQGIFVNFKRLLAFNQGKLPFAAAQIGNSFRNEISPRSGLIRVREFTMAEIEHFCDPRDKSHHKFSLVVDYLVILYSACNQMDGKPAEAITIGEAVDKGLIANQTLGYFIARIHMFLVYIGIDKSRLRFRQHMSNEMAHYACDCWDAECLTSYGWIECVGCADRSAYDLTQHYKATGVKLVAEKNMPEPAVINVKEIVPNKSVLGKTFKQEAAAILTKLRELDLSEVSNVENTLKDTGKYELLGDNKQKYELTTDMISVKSLERTVHVEEFVPNVIEPSFGVGRIMYALLEQNFHIRQEDEQRTYFSLPAVVAPIKCAVFPLGSNEILQPLVKQIANDLLKNRISHKVDDASGSIGRRYTRMDEIAVPFGITVDFDSLSEPHTVTLRERDSTKQLRIPVNKVVQIVNELSNGELAWETARTMYPKFEQQETTKVPSS